MPDAPSLIERGLRYERAGVLDQAMQSYQAAAEAAVTPSEEAEALRRQADVLRIRCEWDDALELAGRSELIAAGAGLVDVAAEAVNAQAAVHQSRGSLESAVPLYRRVLTTARRPRLRGVALQNLGAIAAMSGDHAAAAEHFEESIACFQADGYDRGVAIALNNLGRAALDQANYPRAEAALQRAIGHARQIDDLELASVAGVNLAEAFFRRGAFDHAEQEASAALGFFKVSGNLWRQIDCLRLLGDIRIERDQPDIALRLFEQALLIAERIGAQPEIPELNARIEQTRAAADSA